MPEDRRTGCGDPRYKGGNEGPERNTGAPDLACYCCPTEKLLRLYPFYREETEAG